MNISLLLYHQTLPKVFMMYYLDTQISRNHGLPVTVNKPVIATTEFIDDFSDETTLKITIFSQTLLGVVPTWCCTR
jgi:hypothetical protein